MPDINILVLGEKTEVSELPSNIKLVGRIYEREKMALYYSMCDATILVSRSETFSMPVAESLCCGTPVVGFNAGGPESICIPEYCNFVEYGNIAQLELAIREILDKNFNREEISKSAIAKYSRNVMAEAYIELYKTLSLQ
jgi:glycosyltransferase involved in cell wall biosynthesis